MKTIIKTTLKVLLLHITVPFYLLTYLLLVLLAALAVFSSWLYDRNDLQETLLELKWAASDNPFKKIWLGLK